MQNKLGAALSSYLEGWNNDGEEVLLKSVKKNPISPTLIFNSVLQYPKERKEKG